MALQKTNSITQPVVKTALLSETLLRLMDQPTWRDLLSGTPIGGWLQKSVFRTALRRTQTRFAEAYPQWVASLFDEHFVNDRLLPLLEDRYLHHQTLPEPVELAKTWDKMLELANLEVRQRRIEELTPAARDFIQWLAAELQGAI